MKLRNTDVGVAMYEYSVFAEFISVMFRTVQNTREQVQQHKMKQQTIINYKYSIRKRQNGEKENKMELWLILE